MQLNLAAAAQAVVDRDDQAALHVWKALTGATSYAEAIDTARDYAANPDGQAVLLLTSDTSGADGALLLHLWRNGVAEVSTREQGRWGIPTELVPAP